MTKSASKRPPASILPLDLRLPNPPGAFIGRADALAWLSAAIGRAPVTLVTGPGGIGKTAVVLAAMHSFFPDRAARAIWLDVGPSRPGDQLAQDLLRAIARATGREAEPLPDAGRAVGAALDLAEAHELWVVIDDAADAASDGARELFTQLATYARKSRFVATTRMNPNVPALFGQTLELGAMRSDELVALARAWAPAADGSLVTRSVPLAAGSPWILRQLLSGGLSDRVGERELFSGLSEGAVALLGALAVLSTPLPLAEIAAFEPLATERALAELERRGLVNGASFGVRIHEVARAILRARGSDRAIAARAAASLESSERSEARLEAIRLWVAQGDLARAELVLDGSGAGLFSLGYAPLLFSIIQRVDDPRILRWRLRCAAELGNPTALSTVREAEPSGVEERLAWCRTLLAQGELDSCEREVRAILSTAEGADREEAMLLLARVLRYRGSLADARAVLATLETSDPSRRVRVRAAAVLTGVLEGTASDASFDPSERAALAGDPEAAIDVANALLRLDRPSEARAVLEAIAQSPRALSSALLAGRETKLALAELALHRGEIDAARALADEVRPYARGRSILRPRLVAIDAERKLFAGEHAELASDLALRAELDGIDAASTSDLDAIEVRRAIDFAEPVDLSRMRAAESLRGWATLHRVRATGRRIELPPSPLGSAVIAAAEIASGSYGPALAAADDAVRLGRRRERIDLVAIALALRADAAICAGRNEIVAESATELERISPRFALEAEWYRAALEGVRPAILERLAADRAPIAARRSRSQLGGQSSLDHVDLRVLEAIAERAPGRIALLGEARANEWTPCFGADLVEQRVWFPDGRDVDLAPTPMLARLVETLAETGEATKEALIERAWAEREYHPLRHDGKLHAAVRKLRRLLDEDGSEPRFLLTTESGYRLGLPIRVRHRN